MKSPKFIMSKLVNRTTASSCERSVKNNRVHYILQFDKSIGWDWVYGQVNKASNETKTDLEIWKVHFDDGSLEVRELARREGIDKNQRGLTEFENPKV